ncbi:MAG: hypothetical protein Q8L81_12270 [Bacteroidota bacterium]|nr:hypothetical protein [Bacteroidota bacterium]
MKRVSIYFIGFVFFIFSCKKETKVDNTINLEFTKIYEIDNWENGRGGLLWALSFLGAELKKDSLNAAIIRLDSTRFNLDFSRIGFSANAVNMLKVITDSLKRTEEYKIKNSVDLGAFVSVLLGGSEHYYHITGVERTFAEKLNKHKGEVPIIFPVSKSVVSKNTRVLKVYNKGAYTDWLFIAEEGSGDISKNEFKVSAYEVFDIMPNGQLRFSVYDVEGKIMTGSPEAISEAGKPAKCLWCHEIVIQPLFSNNDSISGYISQRQYLNLVKTLMDTLTAARKKLNSDIDYSKTQDHSLTERLYVGYMEPSIMKLSKEWNIPAKALKDILKNNRTHQYHDFEFFGDIYYRDSIIQFAPFKASIPIFNVRENDAREPNFIK